LVFAKNYTPKFQLVSVVCLLLPFLGVETATHGCLYLKELKLSIAVFFVKLPKHNPKQFYGPILLAGPAGQHYIVKNGSNRYNLPTWFCQALLFLSNS